MNIDITSIVEAIIAILSAVITGLFVPLIKSKLSAEKSNALKFWVGIAVEAAEQLYGSSAGQQKKEYVVSFLLSKGIVFNIDEVTAMIESEVYKLSASSE